MNEGRIIEDDEIKNSNKTSYRKWLDDNLLHLAKVPYTNTH
jgi:glutamate synthase (ferredoxin)